MVILQSKICQKNNNCILNISKTINLYNILCHSHATNKGNLPANRSFSLLFLCLYFNLRFDDMVAILIREKCHIVLAVLRS